MHLRHAPASWAMCNIQLAARARRLLYERPSKVRVRSVRQRFIQPARLTLRFTLRTVPLRRLEALQEHVHPRRTMDVSAPKTSAIWPFPMSHRGARLSPPQRPRLDLARTSQLDASLSSACVRVCSQTTRCSLAEARRNRTRSALGVAGARVSKARRAEAMSCLHFAFQIQCIRQKLQSHTTLNYRTSGHAPPRPHTPHTCSPPRSAFEAAATRSSAPTLTRPPSTAPHQGRLSLSRRAHRAWRRPSRPSIVGVPVGGGGRRRRRSWRGRRWSRAIPNRLGEVCLVYLYASASHHLFIPPSADG